MNETEEEDIPRLYVYEWAAIFTIVGFLAMICTVTQGINQWDQSASVSLKLKNEQKYKSVWIEGAVQNPGPYKVSLEATLEDVISQAKAAPLANLKKIRLEAPVREGQRIVVPAFPQITIHIQGNTEINGEYQIRKGTRLCDLPELFKLPLDADISALSKKRLLKKGEIIRIDRK